VGLNAAGRLYDLNGEVVGEAVDPGQSGILTFQTGHLASGVYIVYLVKQQDLSAVACKATLKVAIVH
jgi:hypothetical protein